MALLDGARELRHREDRHLELAREHLESARDLRHLLHAALDVAVGRHQLEVVDDDQAEARLARLEPPSLRAQLHDRGRAGVVDVDRRLHQAVARRGQPRPVVRSEPARPQPLRLDLRLAAHHPLRHLGLRHLEREQGDGHLVAHAEVGGDAEAERRLPHRGARGEDDEVAGLEPGREEVELAEPRGNAGDLDARLVELRDALEALLEEHLDVREVARRALLAELEDDLLGAIDEVGRLALVALLPEPHDLLARTDEPAERRHLLDDPRVVLDVRRRGDERRELGDARLSPGGLELGALLELVDERDRVHRLALRPQRERRPVHLRVALAVEVRRVEDLADRADGDRREQHRAEDRLLGLEVLRRDDGAQSLPDPLELGGDSRPGSQAVPRGRVQRGACRAHPARCRENRTYVPRLSPPADVLSTDRAKLSSRKHALRARSSARCPHPLWTALRRRAGEHERPQEPSEAQRPGRRQVQAVLAEPRLPAAVRVPVGDDEACSATACRRCGSARSTARRSTRSSPPRAR